MFLGKTQNIRIYDIRSYINIHSFRPLIKKSILTKYEVVNNYKNYHGLFDYKYQKLLNIYTTLVNLKETSFINIEHTYKQKPDAVLCINNNDDDIFGTIIDKKELCPGYLCIIDNKSIIKKIDDSYKELIFINII